LFYNFVTAYIVSYATFIVAWAAASVLVARHISQNA
jgi:hypothetical protein